MAQAQLSAIPDYYDVILSWVEEQYPEAWENGQKIDLDTENHKARIWFSDRSHAIKARLKIKD